MDFRTLIFARIEDAWGTDTLTRISVVTDIAMIGGCKSVPNPAVSISFIARPSCLKSMVIESRVVCARGDTTRRELSFSSALMSVDLPTLGLSGSVGTNMNGKNEKFSNDGECESRANSRKT